MLHLEMQHLLYLEMQHLYMRTPTGAHSIYLRNGRVEASGG
jgi:hypothetical protein